MVTLKLRVNCIQIHMLKYAIAQDVMNMVRPNLKFSEARVELA